MRKIHHVFAIDKIIKHKKRNVQMLTMSFDHEAEEWYCWAAKRMTTFVLPQPCGQEYHRWPSLPADVQREPGLVRTESRQMVDAPDHGILGPERWYNGLYWWFHRNVWLFSKIVLFDTIIFRWKTNPSSSSKMAFPVIRHSFPENGNIHCTYLSSAL